MLNLPRRNLQRDAVRAGIIATYAGVLIWLGYATQRTDFPRLVGLYIVLFALYLFICFSGYFKNGIKITLGAALLLRLCLFFMHPNLTDDYFRYIWDGLLVSAGHNPYLWLPSEVFGKIDVPGITAQLYGELNSTFFYTAYPPAAQLLFGFCAKVGGGSVFGSVLAVRAVTLAAEYGTVYLMYRLCALLNLPGTAAYIYAFNPLVIMELTGNLHLEGVLIFLLLLAVYLLEKGKTALSATGFGLAAGVKPVPLIFLPFLIKRLGIRKSLMYFAAAAAVVLLICLPFLSRTALANFFTSLGLFIRVLQFNSPVYAFIRAAGLENTGALAAAQVILPALGLLGIIILAVAERARGWQAFFTSAMFALTIFLITSANVHAWYLTPLVALAAFTRFRYGLVWSFAVIFTYAAYMSLPYTENLWITAGEYLLVGGWAAWELARARRAAVEETYAA